MSASASSKQSENANGNENGNGFEYSAVVMKLYNIGKQFSIENLT
jgi:hypothetical protein